MAAVPIHPRVLRVLLDAFREDGDGLAIAPEDGRGLYDRFRGRLMFPVRDARGRVIAFGGRIDWGQAAQGDEPIVLVVAQADVCRPSLPGFC